MPKNNPEICGHCAAMRPDNGYCNYKGRYVNFFDKARFMDWKELQQKYQQLQSDGKTAEEAAEMLKDEK